MRSIVWALTTALATTLPVLIAAQAKPLKAHPSVADLTRSVVKIEVDLLNGSATGSGVIVDPSGVIATAAHVLSGARAARVRLSSGDILKVEGLVEADVDLDLALIRVAGFQLSTAMLGNSDSLEVGQRLIAIGSPIGLEATVTDGLLSAVRNDGVRKLLQISIPVSHGSSGGPVFTEQGEVVGLVVSGFRADIAENLNFALPINYVRGKLALAASKTPIPLAEAAIPMPAPPRLAARGTSGNESGPQTVNDGLGLDWRSLRGAEVFQEIKGENGLRQVGLGQYDLSTDPSGAPLFIRHFDLRTRVKIAALRTDDVAQDAIQTELTLGPSQRLHERIQHTSYVSTRPSGITDLLIEGRQFSRTTIDGQTQTGTLPQGTLSVQLVGAAIAAMPDSLPATAFVWVFDPTTGRAEANRVEFGQRDKVKVHLAEAGKSCGPGVYTRDTSVAVVWLTISAGASRTRYPVLENRPHLFADPDKVKCLRRPGWGGTPSF
jgi:S1-C subfamily serine protease